MYDVAACITTAIVLALLSIFAVTLRFYVRLRTTRTFLGIDDWLILFSVVLVCGQMGNQIEGKLTARVNPEEDAHIFQPRSMD